MGAEKRRRKSGNYPLTTSMAKPIWEKSPAMTTFGNFKGETVMCTLEEWNEAGNDTQVSKHEASHCLCGWCMGLPLKGMWLFAKDSIRPPGVDPAAGGVVLQRGVLGEKFSLPYGERLCLAKTTAFLELGGVYGSGESASDNPILQDRTTVHQLGALTMYQRLRDGAVGGKITPDTVEEIQRLIPVVENFFSDQRIRALTQRLANELLKNRHLTGDEIYEFLARGWVEVNKIAERIGREVGVGQ